MKGKRTRSNKATGTARVARRPSLLESLERRVLMSQTFVVTSTSDDATVAHSFRWAVSQVNNDATDSQAAPDVIQFAIPGSGLQTIHSAGLQINNPVLVDGTTQGDTSSGPLIELQGPCTPTTAVAGDGIVLNSAGSAIRGLTIDNFGGAGIVVGGTTDLIGGSDSSQANVIFYNGQFSGGYQANVVFTSAAASGDALQQNKIGLDLAGAGEMSGRDGVQLVGANGVMLLHNVIAGNKHDGISLQNSSCNIIRGNAIGTPNVGNDANGITIGPGSDQNMVGGPGAADQNVIVFSGGDGIRIDPGASASAVIQNNFIGIDANYVWDGNSGDGVNVQSGAASISANVIACNAGNGLTLAAGMADVAGNWIGTDPAGDTTDYTGASLGNSDNGIYISSGNNAIGGTDTGRANVIANNATANLGHGGVIVVSGAGNSIRGNSIYNSEHFDAGLNQYFGLGIDLGADGPGITTAGAAASPNANQNFPVVTSATISGTNVVIKGTLSSGSSQTYTLDFYANATAEHSGYGEGQLYLGSAPVTTAGDGSASFDITLPAPSTVTSGQTIAATVTDTTGDTSEFSRYASITTAGSPSPASATTTLVSSANPSVFGQPVTLTATVAPDSPGGATPGGSVTFKDGDITIGSATLSGGSATMVTSPLSVGTHSITAVYGGDTNFNASTSAPLSQVVNPDNTTTHLVSSNNPSTCGQAVSFTATVAANAPGSGSPSGSISFYDGNKLLGSSAVIGGMTTFSTSSLGLGNHLISAIYAGDGNFAASSDTLTQVVNAPASCPVMAGTAAVTTFWQGGAGQTLINNFNGGPRSTALANWLASTFPNLYGTGAGPNNLTGKTNQQVASFYLSLAKSSPIGAQIASSALSVYATSLSLGGSIGTQFGFKVSTNGLAAETWNVGSNGTAFGESNGSTVTVYKLLQDANAISGGGVYFGGDATRTSQAKATFTAINQTGGV